MTRMFYSTRYLIFSALLLSLVLVLSCTKPGHDFCIKVGEKVITPAMFKERMERYAEESMITDPTVLDGMKPLIVDDIVEELLILKYARDNYISLSQEEVAIAKKGVLAGLSEQELKGILTEDCRDASDITSFIRTRLIIKKALERAVWPKINISEDEVREYYNNHKSEFYHPETVKLYHVFSSDRFKARKALLLLRSGASLDAVVREYSESEDAKNHGFMGIFTKGELPREVERVVFSIPVKRYSGIISTKRGYHIFYVASKTKPGIAPLEDVELEVKDNLTNRKFEQLYRKWIASLKQRYRPEVRWDVINEISLR